MEPFVVPIVIVVGLVLLALVVLGGCFFMVEQAQVGLVERFGRFARVAPAGLNFKLPMIERKAGRLSLRVQQLNVRVETKTRDNVFVDIVVSVQYHVVEGKEFEAFYKLTNPEQQITAHVFDAVRSQVPTMSLDHVFEKKGDIEEAVSTGLRHKINAFGYDIDGSPVTDIAPDEKVRAAMNEINAASRLREAAEQQGEAVKIKTVKAAEAEKESKKLQGEGIAAERIAIAEGIRASVAALLSVREGGISPEEAMKTLILTQYFDTLRAIGAQSRATTVFLPHSPGGAADLSRQISEAIMVGNQVPHPPEDRPAAPAGSVPPVRAA
ncbi:MAG TPA: SPFH domain-containing protein [Stellaceae bacterium]|jgi:regulator of protease activity HflC (stomatin/prohibitin superfamily)|nr:SPFH domain-containing protein [Stellaceae bacterium]